MPLAVALSELRLDFRSEILSSLSPAASLNATTTQNRWLNRTQRLLYNQYDWPHLELRYDMPVPANTQFIQYSSGFPFTFKALRSIWYNQNPNAYQVWMKLGYGFSDSINPLLKSYPVLRWRQCAVLDDTGKTDPHGQIQLW